MVKKLTKTAEEHLLKALNRIADLTNDGALPNDAISKVASDMKLPHGHIQLLVNAYNTGRTTAQRHSAEDVQTKAAEFPLADAAEILKDMYPEEIKTAAELKQDTTVADEYKYAPSWLQRKQASEAKSTKIDWKMVDPPAPYPREDNSFAEAQAQIKKAERELQEARYRTAYVFDMATGLKNEIKDYFKTADALPFAQIKANAIALHGQPAASLFKQLASEDVYLDKQAKHTVTKLQPARGKIYDLVSDCIEVSAAYSDLLEDFETKEANFKIDKEALLRPFVEAPKEKKTGSPASVLGATTENGNFSKKAAPAPKQESGKVREFFSGLFGNRDKNTGFVGALANVPKPEPINSEEGFPVVNNLPGLRGPVAKRLGSLISESPAVPYAKPYREAAVDVEKQRMKDDYKRQLEPDPDYELEGQMDHLEQESMLSDLLANDPVISHHNPHEVLQAYSNLRQIAPRAANSRETLQALLRDRLSRGGGASVFDLDALTKVEKNLQSIQTGKPTKGDE